MPDYRRNRIPGGTYFFTVNLLDCSGTLLVDRIDALRVAVRTVRNRRPFHINPLKHSLVTCVRDWSHSSFHRYVAQGMYAPDWGGTGVCQLLAGERNG